ncbi:PREDICTED: LOW QUALITY PROTEIN: wall-associated receptor kinase-like 15 [Tarenaya hassleriana]|uniref:LOW QUALITY PROTEIN: wall-associated receptor kinase-like 15 n=1 Tax=Tarenaya hassleriana TaxID=28532 RepID=UPI0008FD3262|nr:PREDICTED: LOW QUALITY PROTEIN: wall-associated receptor kinase-like 15 [Tarenaya hassleriana]
MSNANPVKMELQRISFLCVTSALILLFPSSESNAFKQCPACGSARVPYPFSTGPGCGDPNYKIRCSGSTLWFDTLNGSSNPIKSFDPAAQRLILQPPGFKPNTCMAADMQNHGIQLDPNLPFNVSDRNTVIITNCTKDGLDSYISVGFYCSESSLCHKFLVENLEARENCRDRKVNSCCWYKTGGTINTYKLYRAREDKCSAYQSYVDLDLSLPVSKWGDPAVEIEWNPPREPPCKFSGDCKGLANSVCTADPENLGQKRCFCKKGFQWDSVNGVCKVVGRCSEGKRCKKWSKVPMIGGLVGGIGSILMAGWVVKLRIARQNRRIAGSRSWKSICKLQAKILGAHSGGFDRIFSGKEIIKATNDFANSNLIGFGGFGEVFKGDLDDGTTIAVKRAKLGNEKSVYQIVNEVRILCQVSHKNLVKLLGCCVELEMPILVYEFVPNGTLFDHLHGVSSVSYDPLPWLRRLLIAHQTAQALAYLHSSATPPIYHRDIKSSNILLDSNLDAKVSDFGLSRLGVSDVSHVTTCAQGTLGYLDPEYYLNFQLTDKSDVYSFGVVLIELLTSKKAIDFNREEEDVNLAVFVRKALREERLPEVIDPVIGKRATAEEMESMRDLGFLAERCLKETRHDRPTMQAVAKELETLMHAVACEF